MANQAIAAEAQLKRALLSSGGVGYFEYEAEVNGHDSVEISAPVTQIDDILKSIVAYDDKGASGVISLPSKGSTALAFRDVPFGAEAFNSLPAMIGALKGEEALVITKRRMMGRIASVTRETTTNSDGATITRHRVALVSEKGVEQFVLEDATTISFRDRDLNEKIAEALAELSRQNQKDRKALTIAFEGEGKRTAVIGYVVSAPLWKTTYRLTIPAKTDEQDQTGQLEGWALLENETGQDWEDVELTLVTGNPVTFRQAVYSNYYVSRPEVPVEIVGRILPEPNTGAVDYDRERRSAEADGYGDYAEAAPPPKPKNLNELLDAVKRARVEDNALNRSRESQFNRGAGHRLQTQATTTEAATQVVFRLKEKISVRNGHSLAAPIISKLLPAERIALFQPETHDRHPLAAIKLTNASQTGLPPGVMTIYEKSPDLTSFVGDAQLSVVPKGEERLIAYAVDQKTIVDVEVRHSERLVISSLAEGYAKLATSLQTAHSYIIKTAADEPRSMLIEVPRYEGSTLVEPDDHGVKTTHNKFRVPTLAAAGQESKFRITVEWPVDEMIWLARLSAPQIAVYVKDGELSEQMLAVFEKLGELRSAVDAEEQRKKQMLEQRERIFAEQKRIAENLKAIPDGSALQKRYLGALDRQETELERINTDIADAEKKRDEARAALNEYATTVEV
jgi:hypothetical protein